MPIPWNTLANGHRGHGRRSSLYRNQTQTLFQAFEEDGDEDRADGMGLDTLHEAKDDELDADERTTLRKGRSWTSAAIMLNRVAQLYQFRFSTYGFSPNEYLTLLREYVRSWKLERILRCHAISPQVLPGIVSMVWTSPLGSLIECSRRLAP
ncbi:hypothetical protein BD311DRAFT_808739 [Dichomitus squalens]|uniref:Uncharacterized protein n=1 Tax=Dichomitus squalens TaxID=114155 RepID=A0A4Q9MHI8_9APHY|nr:hypothetical protein BD311DRAFT_808739 [Dichomitus squalens]